MRITNGIMFSVLTIFGATTVAHADSDKYLSLKFGASVVEDNGVSDSSITTLSDGKYEADFGHAVSGAIGMAFRDGYRLEFEVANQINDAENISATEIASGTRETVSISGVDASVTTFLANAYKDFNIAEKLSAYVGAGVGLAYGDLDGTSGSVTYGATTVTWTDGSTYDDTVFAWQLGTGLGYDLTKEITLDLGYRYLGTDDFSYKTVKVEYGSHNVTAGIRYSF